MELIAGGRRPYDASSHHEVVEALTIATLLGERNQHWLECRHNARLVDVLKDDAWRQAHLAMLEGLQMQALLRCDACGRSMLVDPREFAERHGLNMLTPMLTISRRLRCTACGERKAGCRPAPPNSHVKGGAR